MTRASSHAARPAGPGRAQVHDVVATLRERLDDRRDARDADLQAGVERDVDLGDGAEAAIDVGVGADHLDVEAGDAALADLLDRVRDAVHAADPVGDERDARTLAVARVSFSFSRPRKAAAAAYGIAGMQASNRSTAAPDEVERRLVRSAIAATRCTASASRRSWIAAGAAEEIGMAESSSWSSASSSRSSMSRSIARQPRAQQRERVLRPEVDGRRRRGARRPRASRARRS